VRGLARAGAPVALERARCSLRTAAAAQPRVQDSCACLACLSSTARASSARVLSGGLGRGCTRRARKAQSPQHARARVRAAVLASCCAHSLACTLCAVWRLVAGARARGGARLARVLAAARGWRARSRASCSAGVMLRAHSGEHALRCVWRLVAGARARGGARLARVLAAAQTHPLSRARGTRVQPMTAGARHHEPQARVPVAQPRQRSCACALLHSVVCQWSGPRGWRACLRRRRRVACAWCARAVVRHHEPQAHILACLPRQTCACSRRGRLVTPPTSRKICPLGFFLPLI
jgi:FAD/FMN-containing dehydrogenase